MKGANLMEYEHRDYFIKIDFVGDSITPVYRFRLHKEKRFWFPKVLWEETIFREDIKNYKISCDKVIDNYEKNKARWN